MITSRCLSRYPDFTMMGCDKGQDISIEVYKGLERGSVNLKIRIQDQGCVNMFLSTENFDGLLKFFRSYGEKEQNH